MGTAQNVIQYREMQKSIKDSEEKEAAVKAILQEILEDLDGKQDGRYIGKYNGVNIALSLLGYTPQELRDKYPEHFTEKGE